MKSIISRLCLCFALVPLFAEISFLSPDINNRNEVLFSVKADIPGGSPYQTLFLDGIDTGKLEQLTFYPEAMESLSGGTVLQIRNRFGSGRYDTRSGDFAWLNDYRPFYSGGSVSFGMMGDVSPSPDGHWQVSIEPLSPARGRLVMYDTVKGLRYVLSESVERGAIPVSWAPDSSVLIYSKDHTLYFARPESFFSVDPIDEHYRVLGQGEINSVSWFSASRLLYVSDSTVYRIQSSELFARSLYTPLIGIGELAGKLPCAFDPVADTFCASPDGNAVLFAEDGRNVYYAPLEGDDYISNTRPALLPYLLLPGNTAGLSFIWTADSVPAVFAESVEDGKKNIKAWTLSDFSGGKIFTALTVPAGATRVIRSPDGSCLAFLTRDGLVVYTTKNWKEAAVFRDEPVISAAWGIGSELFVGGTETVRKWDFRTGAASLLFLSSAATYGWDETGASVLVDTGHLGRFSYAGSLKWTPAAAGRLRSGASANGAWRLYLDSGKGYFANMIYARSAISPGGTKALVKEPAVKLDSLAAASAAKTGGAASDETDILTHGSRTGFRQIALTFDAMDSLDGLPEILNILDRYKIQATFFINGEFIRQHPAAVNEIVRAGHQTASLFFTTWDLSGTRYRIDEDFIIRGLSRNEDDFYTATGQELTLLWHAPYYVTSPMIIAAGQKAGYRYVSGDVTVLDWVTVAQEKIMPGLYRSSADLIEDILAAKKPGSIIPIRIGKVAGERTDYLYDKIDLLINALTEAGYSIVTVDTLIKNLR